VVVDPVAQEIARFQSNHDASRRDAAMHLGRMGDARAVMPLVDRLKNDRSRDVRVAAATALGEIGSPAASVYLERSIVYDKKQEVRDAATAALARLRQVPPDDQAAASPTSGFSSSPAQTSQVPSLSPLGEDVPPPPRPANGPR
ncbi:MAG: HEAT repeat domain-containing protein, partial [Planctomycetia bacterium]|nr:HEAT repeat domain-containing protein [Planctomycetia bacterium]